MGLKLSSCLQSAWYKAYKRESLSREGLLRRASPSTQVQFFRWAVPFLKFSRWLNGNKECLVVVVTAEIVSNSVLYFVKADNIWCEIISGCCVSFCFPCAVYRDAEALNKSGIFCGLISCFFPCIPTFLLRGEAREKYGIEGSTCGDAMCSFFCNRCVQCQIGNEIEERGDRS